MIDLRHPYAVDLIECPYCDTGVRPGERCECRDGNVIPDDDLLPEGCCICEGPLYEQDAVRTGHGLAHEDCAEATYGPDDPSRDPGIPKR